MANKRINVTSLDFDDIKNSLKDYLRGQTTFQDYDFEGSGMSVLLDVLAYNTHYNALYNNLAINEMFLDSARKRNSVVSIARELGYMPQSAQCASAIVNITCSRSSQTSIQYYIPVGTPFTTIVDGTTYTFYTQSELLSPATTATTYTFSGVVLIEKSNQFTHNYSFVSSSGYLIPNQYADLSTLIVTVNGSPYTSTSNITEVDSTSKVYWTKELDDNQYEIIFGNGVIGYMPAVGDIISISYAVSSLDVVNGARVFNFSGTPQSGVSYLITTVSPASNGSYPEDIESIRFNAPRSYASQNRAVSANDYKAHIQSNFQEAKSVAVWGGEDNYPPEYGKVFVCVKPKSSDYLTTSQKDYIISDILSNKNVMTVTPTILDPEYINLIVTTTVYYNDLVTTRSADSIKSVVVDAINNYNITTLQQFDGIFKFSKYSKTVDESEPSIVSNITTLYLKKLVTPKFNIPATYTINLLNPIYFSGAAEDIITSSGFYVSGSTNVHYLVDDGVGNMMMYYVDNTGTRYIIDSNIGTVDYTKGIIAVNSLNISALEGDYFVFYIKPSSNDVVSTLHQIVQISMDDLVVNVINDKSASGDLRAGQNYTFTTSRN